jgi:queuine tRNA-ribosyltransferase catalytic subunit
LSLFRTTRWLDRCIGAHDRPSEQNIFPIVQGGLDADLREQSAKMHIARDVNGFAVGGLRYFFAEPITKNTVD